MSVLLILEPSDAMAIPTYEEGVTMACMGILGRVGDAYQPYRDMGNVIFTGGMEPALYLTRQGIKFTTIIDGRSNVRHLD